jgi:hypothetical protein
MTGTDEFPTLDCGVLGTAGPLNGRALYYRFTARAGLKYEIRILDSRNYDPDVVYVFPASSPCTVEAIGAACRSGGVTGAASATVQSGGVVFRPSAPGDYVVAVDSDNFPNTPSPGGPFTLAIFEYCDSATTGCKTQVCSALLPFCDANVATTCNDDGTGTTGTRTDCTATGATCSAGRCQASISDYPGLAAGNWTSVLATAASGTAVNFYAVDKDRTLTQIAQDLSLTSAVPLTWVVYEATTQTGAYQNILSKPVTSSGTTGSQSGPISVRLVAGRYYAIGVGWGSSVQYRASMARSTPALPQATFFGQLTSAQLFTAAPETATVTYQAPGTLAFPQALTTTL